MRAALVALALALCGCPFGGVTQLNRLPKSEPLAQPELVNRPGPLLHEPTGFEFAERHPELESPVVAVVHTPLRGERVLGPSFRFREAGNLSELRLQLYDRQ